MNIVINGDFLCRSMTGIERFAAETCMRLDALAAKTDAISIYIPRNAENIPSFKNIEIKRSSAKCRFFPLWEHVVFSFFAAKSRALPLDFSNATPLFYPGIVFLHDIYAELYPQDFSGVKGKLMRLYMRLMYRHTAKHAKKIITVSQFSRRQIAETFRIPQEKIAVIYNGWEHFQNIKTDAAVFERFPALLRQPFYFTLGSFQKRKNLKWIAEYAAKHPEEMFAISGKLLSGLVPDELRILQKLPNITLLGYVADGEVKALMKKCRAFIFPSYYEGFGIPPLEALSCGAPVVVSRTASLPEIYGSAAHYIDADKADIELESLLAEPAADCAPLLEKYSYRKAAEALFGLLKEFLTA
ncbi:MAG: glycosyltransferase family 4 protein [Bacteroides sp.]|nr:glycosyltransferase family 4 protein [Prevotella sp.]MCM1407853.1 glycosyltransferase family 4 protein [Treponema brennaborense]MCM1469595.1 glycosyltransferase family 4 protein [Bacteroides sp.]